MNPTKQEQQKQSETVCGGGGGYKGKATAKSSHSVGLSHILCEREGSRRFPSNRVKRNKAAMVIQGKGWQALDKKGGLQDRPQKIKVHPWGYEVDKQPSKKDNRSSIGRRKRSMKGSSKEKGWLHHQPNKY